MTPSKPTFRDGFENKTATAQKILLYVITGVWTRLATMWKNKRLVSKHNHVLYLSPPTSIHLKNMET